MPEMTREQILQAIDNGVKRGVRAALREHKLLGHSIVIWRDGKVVEIPPEEIPDFEEETSSASSPPQD
jgi:hypothetical protein